MRCNANRTATDVAKESVQQMRYKINAKEREMNKGSG